MERLNPDAGLLAKNDQLEKEVTDLRAKFFEALKLVKLGALGVTCESCGAKPAKCCYGNGPMAFPHHGRNELAVRQLDELLSKAADAT
jgi:hypothetical protein